MEESASTRKPVGMLLSYKNKACAEEAVRKAIECDQLLNANELNSLWEQIEISAINQDAVSAYMDHACRLDGNDACTKQVVAAPPHPAPRMPASAAAQPAVGRVAVPVVNKRIQKRKAEDSDSDYMSCEEEGHSSSDSVASSSAESEEYDSEKDARARRTAVARKRRVERLVFPASSSLCSRSSRRRP